MLHVDVQDVTHNEDGTINATLVCDGTAVRGECIAWLDEEQELLLAAFEEWHDFATEGEEGFWFVEVA